MEVLQLSGYTEEEKTEIARRHLIPRQIEENGLSDELIHFSAPAIRALIHGYTREAGLRNLERQIASVCRKVAVKVAEGHRTLRRITPAVAERLLGPKLFLPEEQLKEDRVGVVTGLAYTAVGGDILFIEALALPGKGELKLTGSLGEVMKESANAALSFARAHREDYGIPGAWFEENSLHVHVPAGAIPKDGPSAGIALLTAIVSAAAGRTVRHDLAMTGEITLRGEVLPVGGIKEKVLAALRAGLRDVILPTENERDLSDLPPKARRKARIRFVSRVEEVLDAALLPTGEGEPSQARPSGSATE
jgi:ATP-dependent Lon protease